MTKREQAAAVGATYRFADVLTQRLRNLEEQFAGRFTFRRIDGWEFGFYEHADGGGSWWWRCPCHGIQRFGHGSFVSVQDDCYLEHDARLSEDLSYGN
ncbi:MAG: hypothetical protein ACRDNK_04330 [Solirubrobacteraceae bacterium]